MCIGSTVLSPMFCLWGFSKGFFMNRTFTGLDFPTAISYINYITNQQENTNDLRKRNYRLHS